MAPPERQLPPQNWTHYALYERVRRAIYALPGYFKTETYISGIQATDIFTLGDVLGATIEEQVVKTLNATRSIWDPTGDYKLYIFERQAQAFPDVRLRSRDNGQDIIIGIELKSWYLLAKEGEPNFRYAVTEAACNLQDMLVVVPWALSNVLSGAPAVFTPWIESARYAAAYRNYYWQELRRAGSPVGIKRPEGVGPYPSKADKIQDIPVSDPGRNFGRIARTGIMNHYVHETTAIALCGIEAREWVKFFKRFAQ